MPGSEQNNENDKLNVIDNEAKEINISALPKYNELTEENDYLVNIQPGRPPIYERPEDLLLKVEKYFKRIAQLAEKPTVTGLALFLGFSCRDSMYEYKEKSLNYFYIIKRAQTVIEKYYELGLHDNKRVSGAIFALKNMGWYDNQVIDLGLDKLIRLPEVKEEEKHKITSKIKDKI